MFDSWISGTDAKPADAVEVAVAVPANLTDLPVLRSIAATVGTTLDFDIDAIADLRMAVDEMASMLMTRARDGARLSVQFSAAGDRVDVRAVVAAMDGVPVDQDSFGWTVLTTLARDVTASASETEPGRPDLAIRLSVVADRGGS